MVKIQVLNITLSIQTIVRFYEFLMNIVVNVHVLTRGHCCFCLNLMASFGALVFCLLVPHFQINDTHGDCRPPMNTGTSWLSYLFTRCHHAAICWSCSGHQTSCIVTRSNATSTKSHRPNYQRTTRYNCSSSYNCTCGLPRNRKRMYVPTKLQLNIVEYLLIAINAFRAIRNKKICFSHLRNNRKCDLIHYIRTNTRYIYAVR